MYTHQPSFARRHTRLALALLAIAALVTPAAAAPWTKILEGMQGNTPSPNATDASASRAKPSTAATAPGRVGANASSPGNSIRQAPPAAERAPVAEPRGDSSDPTRPTNELRALLAAEDAAKATPTSTAIVIPLIQLRALVVGKTAEPSAMIRIGEKETRIVRPGREYPLAGGTAQAPASLLIRSITADAIEMEIRPTGQIMLLP